jgi:hypothetical protein
MATQIWLTERDGSLHFDLESGQRLATLQEFENNVPCESGSLWFAFSEGEEVVFADGLYIVDYDRDEGLCPVLRKIG